MVLREIKDGTDCSWPPPSPNMVTLQEVGELQGKRHALFPWVPGVTLRELIKALELIGAPAPLGLIGRVIVDAARALATITPSRPHGGINDAAMQIGFDGHVSVLDFGAPRISRFKPIGRVNFAADVFALGGVLHAMLTGFQGDYASPPVTLASPSTSHPEATPAIDDVVMRALSQQPDSRQASAAAFADELEAVLGNELFAKEKLAEVVNTLFRDRIKLLHSLGGMVEEHPSLEAVLPPASDPLIPIPQGTQPGVGGPAAHPEAPSEPTLPRVVDQGDAPVERTETRIPLATAPVKPSPSLVPWDSAPELPSAHDSTQTSIPNPAYETEPLTRPSSGPPLSGPRPSSPGLRAVSEPETNPRAAAPRTSEPDTNPGVPVPTKRPADTDETSGPLKPGKSPADTGEDAPAPRASAPRPLGAEDEHAATIAGGPRALSRSDVEAARPPRFDVEAARPKAPPESPSRSSSRTDVEAARPKTTSDDKSPSRSSSRTDVEAARPKTTSDDKSPGRSSVEAVRPKTTSDEKSPSRSPSRTDVEASRPRTTSDDRNPRARLDAAPAEDTNPRARLDAAPAEDTNPRARLDAAPAEDTNPRARPPPEDTNLRAKPDLPEDTAPRARPPEAPPRPRASVTRTVPPGEEGPADSGPLPQLPPHPRNTTEAERERAIGQERLCTPPQGVQLGGGDDDEDGILNEPTAVKEAVRDPQETAQTAQTLPPAPAPEGSSGAGLRVLMVALLVVVVGLAGAIVLKLKRQSELAPPLDEPVAEVDAGVVEQEPPDAGPLAVALAAVPDAGDAGDDEEEEDADAGEADPVADAGSTTLDAGQADAGTRVKKPPVKKVVKKKKKKKPARR